MLIKICGLTNKSEVEYLKKNKVDFAGIVLFFEKSKRNVSIDKAKEIIAALKTFGDKDYEKCGDATEHDIKAVAVVVSPNEQQVKEIEAAGFDYIQIHGALDEELIRKINIPVLRAFNVDDMDKYDYYLSFPNIKGFVFDAGEPGSGKTFDWDSLKTIKRQKNRMYILAGGLNAENVSRAIEMVKPDGVDVSSSVEYTDKLGKNPALIDEFFMKVRTAQS